MKTRIMINTTTHPSEKTVSEYYPQYKGWFFWHCFDSNIIDWMGLGHFPQVFSTQEEAEKYIDNVLSEKAEEKAHKKYEKQKKTKKTYVRYP